MNFGELMRKAGKPAEALEQFQKAWVITDRLVTWDPTNATWKNDFEFVQARIAELRATAPGR